MSFCGLRNREKRELRRLQKGKSVERGNDSYNNPASRFVDVRGEHDDFDDSNERNQLLRRKSADFEWAREDQLSVILEILEETSRNTPNWEKDESALGWDRVTPPAPPKIPPLKRTRFVDRDSRIRPIPEHYAVNMSEKITPDSPRPIQSPPRDVS